MAGFLNDIGGGIDSFFERFTGKSKGPGWGERNFGGNWIGKGAKSYIKSGVHQQGMDWVKWNFGIDKGAKGVGRLLGPAMLAYSMYGGYKQGGVQGAVKEGGKTIGESYVFGAVTKALGGGWGVAGIIAAGTATAVGMSGMVTGGSPLALWARPWVRDHTRSLNRLELGVPISDQFGTIATSRQRAIQAIQGSRINGRSALGNEAALMYTPYFR